MNITHTLTSLCVTASTLLFVSCAATPHATTPATPAGISETAPPAPPDVSSAELNRIKQLAGRWESTTSMFGEKDQKVFTEYKISAGGSAVVETIFPGTPQEMVSVYYDDDHGKLAMTHYCMMRNRPYFSLVESGSNQIKLDVTKVEGLTSKDAPSMGAITLNFEDADHFSTTCESRGSSDHKHDPMTMRFSRVRE